MPALLFGSISTIADTSELQRQAFNEAFEEHGIDWRWDQDDYRELLESNGGRDRVAQEAKKTGIEVDADAVHGTKSERFRQHVAQGISPRPGVVDAIRDAKAAGFRIGLVTTTSADNVTALLDAVEDLGPDDFDVVVDASSVETPKPDPAAYLYALRELGEDAGACVAVEDNVGGTKSADQAGVVVAAFPNENTAGHDFGSAQRVTDPLTFDGLRALTPQA